MDKVTKPVAKPTPKPQPPKNPPVTKADDWHSRPTRGLVYPEGL